MWWPGFKESRPSEGGGGWDELDLASLEAEALLIGTWKNVEELEEYLSLDELRLIIEQKREEEWRLMKFQASLKGIDLEKQAQKHQEVDRVQQVKDELAAKALGKSVEHYQFETHFGHDIEIEEE